MLHPLARTLDRPIEGGCKIRTVEIDRRDRLLLWIQDVGSALRRYHPSRHWLAWVSHHLVKEFKGVFIRSELDHLRLKRLWPIDPYCVHDLLAPKIISDNFRQRNRELLLNFRNRCCFPCRNLSEIVGNSKAILAYFPHPQERHELLSYYFFYIFINIRQGGGGVLPELFFLSWHGHTLV
jgi:hypothetical protein